MKEITIHPVKEITMPVAARPATFSAKQMTVADGTQYVRRGGTHTVVVPDLRGMGLSSHPEGGLRGG